MFALNFKYSFKSPVKPAIGVGIDYLSGDDGQDADKYKVFNTLYATNHKYYGFMDCICSNGKSLSHWHTRMA